MEGYIVFKNAKKMFWHRKNAVTIYRKIKIQNYIYRIILVLLKCIEKKNMKIMPND